MLPHSPCQDHKECKENSMRNMTANVEVERVKTTNRENATFCYRTDSAANDPC